MARSKRRSGELAMTIKPSNTRPTKLPFLRFVAGMTQSDLSKKINCDHATISLIESGQMRNTPAVIRHKTKIAEVFGLAVEEIFPKGGQED
jgi:DNA-binding XRE family transcriptional regulator